MTPPTTKGAATGPRLLVRGHGGLLAGVKRTLAPGETLVVGRSRSCHLSLRKTRVFEHREDAAEVLVSPDFNRVSRIHCEIEFRDDGDVEIRDLSQNGTIVGGVRVHSAQRITPSVEPITVELVDGTWGKLLVSCAPQSL